MDYERQCIELSFGDSKIQKWKEKCGKEVTKKESSLHERKPGERCLQETDEMNQWQQIWGPNSVVEYCWVLETLDLSPTAKFQI